MSLVSRGIAQGLEVDELLSLSASVKLDDLLKSSLLGPLDEFFGRPGKKIRASLVEAGFRLGSPGVVADLESSTPLSERAADILELIHAGSLIVDDIQDGSKVRRGAPAMHLRYGMPLALNAGNWLYFWPMEQIRRMELKPETELELYRMCHRTLLRAHFGQALDVGVPIDSLPQGRVYEVSMASIELKSGALTALALGFGAVLGGVSGDLLQRLERFGHQFGMALQMFDDLGNLKANPETVWQYSKRFEDLYLKRPSWVWAAASKLMDSKAYSDFVTAVSRLPDESFLNPWFEIHEFVPRAREFASQFLERAFHEFEQGLGDDVREASSVVSIRDLVQLLTHAYE